MTFVSNFSWDLQSSQEELKTILTQTFWGVNKVYCGNVQVVNTKSSDCSPYISYGTDGENLLNNQDLFSDVDHFPFSHDFIFD